MLRVRFTAPKGSGVSYKSMDTVHDAAIAMFRAAGADLSALIGAGAKPWSAGVVFPSKGVGDDKEVRRGRTVVVSTSDPDVARWLASCDPSAMRSRRAGSQEEFNIDGWKVDLDPAPVVPGTMAMAAVCGTPIVFSRKPNDRGNGKWFGDVRQLDVGAAVSFRLSRIAGRQVSLTFRPDESYLASRRSHAVFSKVKADKGPGVVVGLCCPFVLEGSSEDLELAWYAGLGEKNRMGFGIICSV